MTITEPSSASATRRPTGKAAGYVVAIVVNVILLVAVNTGVLWDLLPFVTADIDRVVPLLNLSLAASAIVNAAYLAYDATWFTGLTQVVVLSLSMLVTVRLLQVFPFDFAGSDVPWETLLRVGLLFAIVGVAIAMIVEAVRFVVGLARP